MSKQIKLSDLLRDSAYKLTQFKPAQIQALEASITMKDTGEESCALRHLLDAWQADQAHTRGNRASVVCHGAQG